MWGCFVYYILEMGEIWDVKVGVQSFLKVYENEEPRSELRWYFLKGVGFEWSG